MPGFGKQDARALEVIASTAGGSFSLAGDGVELHGTPLGLPDTLKAIVGERFTHRDCGERKEPKPSQSLPGSRAKSGAEDFWCREIHKTHQINKSGRQKINLTAGWFDATTFLSGFLAPANLSPSLSAVWARSFNRK